LGRKYEKGGKTEREFFCRKDPWQSYLVEKEGHRIKVWREGEIGQEQEEWGDLSLEGEEREEIHLNGKSSSKRRKSGGRCYRVRGKGIALREVGRA